MSLSVEELESLYDKMTRRVGGGSDALKNDGLSIRLLTRANRMGTLKQFLESIEMSDLLEDDYSKLLNRGKKVIVFGASELSKGALESLVRKAGIDVTRFEFCLDYDIKKRFDSKKLRNKSSYCAVFAGPIPHSTPGKNRASSLYQNILNNPGCYIDLIELKDSHNQLKITRKTFCAGLDELKARGFA